MEPEFKCYLRPVIEDNYDGWAFVANNLQTSPRKSIYPMVYSLRQHLYDLEIQKKEKAQKYRLEKLEAERKRQKQIDEEKISYITGELKS